MKTPSEPGFLSRWSWLCPLLSVLLAAALLVAFGFTWWRALLAALLLVCPALLVWGAVEVARDRWQARHRRSGRP